MSKINSKTTIFQLKNQPHFHMSQRLYDDTDDKKKGDQRTVIKLLFVS